MKAKYYLKKWHPEKFQALNSNETVYILHCTKVSLFGLFKTKVEIHMKLPFHYNHLPYYERWDHLIKTQEPFTK